MQQSTPTLAHATFRNSAGWTIHPTYCDGVLVSPSLPPS
eukprot:COSAG03_NODE_28846_length_193_cov_33.031915_1_plen_38_part_01